MRSWNNGQDTSQSVHSMGDGRLCVYEKGPVILQCFGSPYSGQSVFSAEPVSAAPLACESERLDGTNTWVHNFTSEGRSLGVWTDFVSDCGFVRTANFREPFRMKLLPGEQSHLEEDLVVLPVGSWIYSKFYPSKEPTVMALGFEGCAREGDEVVFPAGESVFFATAAKSESEARAQLADLMKRGASALRRENEADWSAYLGRIRLPALRELPFKERLLEAAKGVAVLLRSQQSKEGGVLAGYSYHLAYVRDQFGVFRCFEALGLFEEAGRILAYYRSVFEKFGVIHNAQAMGVDGVFHVHENDDVEITGYLILQAFDFFERTGDRAFFESLLPMLTWALSRQAARIHNGMLPFNGDETYIAGSYLPRFAMDEGSAEATLLYIISAEKLLGYLGENKLESSLDLAAERAKVAAVKADFRKNFVHDGKLATNSPARREGLVYPEARHGVCVACGHFGDLVVSAQGYDVCENCREKRLEYTHPLYFLPAVSLCPLYLGADMFSQSELESFATAAIDSFLARFEGGTVPNAVGYEFGYMLFAMTSLGHPACEKLAGFTLDICDDVGAWSEYYTDGRPVSTRCRPWESGINLESLLRFAKK